MKFGVVIASYQAAKTLRRCLDSIFTQKHCTVQVVVIDACSDDGSVEILYEYGDRLTYWVSEPDQGIYDAWNKALPHVSDCDWICFLGADDQFASDDVLARADERLHDLSPEVLFAYGKLIRADADGKLIEQFGERWDLCKKLAAVQIPIPHTATFHRKEAFARFGNFDITFRIAGDYDLLLRAGWTYPPYFIDDLVVSVMQMGGVSSNRKFELKALNEFVRVRRKNRFRPYIGGRFAWVYAKAVVKKIFFMSLGVRATNWIIDGYRSSTGRPAIGKNDL